MSEDERQQLIAFIKAYARADRPQLFESGAWLEHHIEMNWQLFLRAHAARPALTLKQFLAEEKQNNPWTRE